MTTFWRKKKLLEVVPMSASTLWRKIKAGNFPAPVRISENIPAWDADLVTAWLADRQTVTPENTKQVAPGAKRGRKPKVQALTTGTYQ